MSDYLTTPPRSLEQVRDELRERIADTLASRSIAEASLGDTRSRVLKLADGQLTNLRRQLCAVEAEIAARDKSA